MQVPFEVLSVAVGRRRAWARGRKRCSCGDDLSAELAMIHASYSADDLDCTIKTAATSLSEQHGYQVGVIKFDGRGQMDCFAATTNEDTRVDAIIHRYRKATKTFDGADPTCAPCAAIPPLPLLQLS